MPLMKRRGKLIVIEGGDASGKATQTQMAVNWARQSGISVRSIDFPQYENNFFGQIIRAYLSGQFGDPTKIDPRLAGVLYCMDRFESVKQIVEWLTNGINVVCDRFHTANDIHQGAKAAFDNEEGTFDEDALRKLIAFLDKIEFKVLKVPRPDLVIYLHVFPKVSQALMKEQGRTKDGHETSDFIQKSEQVALWLCRRLKWKKIECCPNGHSILPEEEIHDMIWHEIVKVL